ncbi:Phytoene desaturase [Coniochaeta hoffmannii]|uniref:Phytoene desaturase n=1 Tax=Coniochaeta hoffmannii TaxID=91930 RepID=A0AA38VID5_9PEZI|nr:Phytoene desaturase [Coniochaeta hoffmannii]
MDTKSKPLTAIVIGAGAGGIAAAARLAKAGLDVTVLEKNDFAGGRCSLMHTSDGYRFDQGPSLLLLPNLFRETFHELDSSLEAAGVELLRCPTNYDIFFADGERFRSTPDEAVMKREIERWEGKDGFRRYLQWKAEAHDHYEISLARVLRRNFTSLWQLAGPKFVWHGVRLHPLESIWSRTTRYFWTERLRRVFTFATMYMGMSPFDAPSTYSLLQYTELAEGIWYPKGGFQTVLAALVRIGQDLGVKYRMRAPVRRVLTTADGKTANGVELEGGERLSADIVVVNADLVYSYSNLFPQSSGDIADYSRKLRQKDASCSSISFYWSLSRKVPELGTHNIFLADDYKESFDAIFKDQSLPHDPSFYINVPSRIDPTAAPEGRDAVIALVPVGHLLRSRGKDTDAVDPSLRDQDWPALVAKARETVLRTVSARTGCERLDGLITHEIVNTPSVWEEKFNLDKGAILGLSHNFTNVLAFRPQTKARGVKNAYFVGASTHPGTGVPIVLAGARITTEQILEEKGIPVPWRGKGPAVNNTGVPQDHRTSAMDKLDPPLWSSDFNLVVGTVIAALLLLVAILLRSDTLVVGQCAWTKGI